MDLLAKNAWLDEQGRVYIICTLEEVMETMDCADNKATKLIKEGISQIKERMNTKQLYIEAQCYAIGYYEKEGFKVCSEEFLEDGIPHVQMTLDL